jgi:hypothetical protein
MARVYPFLAAVVAAAAFGSIAVYQRAIGEKLIWARTEIGCLI